MANIIFIFGISDINDINIVILIMNNE